MTEEERLQKKTPTGHRIAAVAQRLGVHPVSLDSQVPKDTMCAIAPNGDCFDLADVFEALLARVETLEAMKR